MPKINKAADNKALKDQQVVPSRPMTTQDVDILQLDTMSQTVHQQLNMAMLYRKQIAQKDREIFALRSTVAKQSAEIAKLKKQLGQSDEQESPEQESPDEGSDGETLTSGE